MPIEFPCPQCGRTLRTPDGSAGKRAKCPSCEAVAEIPLSSAPAAPTADTPSASSPGDSGGGQEANPFAGHENQSAQGSNPFGTAGTAAANNPFAEASGAGAGGASGGYDDAINPYASPHVAGYTPDAAPKVEIRRAKIDFGEVLGITWRIFTNKLGDLVLLTLMLIGIVIGCYIIMALGAGAGMAVGAAFGQDTIMFIGAAVGAAVVGIGLLFFGGWIGAGLTKYTIDLAQGRPTSLSAVFSGQRYMMRMTGFLFLTQVLIAQGFTYLGMGIGMIADDQALQLIGQYSGQLLGAIINGFFFALGGYFIVDRDCGVIESLSMSIEYLHGNRLILFALYLVVTILGTLFMVFTCGIGLLFYLPYYFMFMAVVYLMATGQMARR